MDPGAMRGFQIVVVATKDEHGIGKQGTLAWKLPTDMKFFKTVTMTTNNRDAKNAVIMGWCTWDSILAKFQPLSGRLNAVLTLNMIIGAEGILVGHSFSHALTLLASTEFAKQVEIVFVISGG